MEVGLSVLPFHVLSALSPVLKTQPLKDRLTLHSSLVLGTWHRARQLEAHARCLLSGLINYILGGISIVGGSMVLNIWPLLSKIPQNYTSMNIQELIILVRFSQVHLYTVR